MEGLSFLGSFEVEFFVCVCFYRHILDFGNFKANLALGHLVKKTDQAKNKYSSL